MPLYLHKSKAAQKSVLTCLAVKSVFAQGRNEEEEQQCLLWLERGMQLFSLTTKDIEPYVDSLAVLVFLNECSEDERRCLLEHSCLLNRFDERFAQLQYLYAQKNCPDEVLEFLRSNYRSFRAKKLSKRKAARLASLGESSQLPERWFNPVRYDFE